MSLLGIPAIAIAVTNISGAILMSFLKDIQGSHIASRISSANLVISCSLEQSESLSLITVLYRGPCLPIASYRLPLGFLGNYPAYSFAERCDKQWST